VAGTVATAVAASALAGRTILDRLAHEFCPFPAQLSAHLREQRFFSRLSTPAAESHATRETMLAWGRSNGSLCGCQISSRRVDSRSSGSAGWITGSSGLVIGAAVRRRRNTRLDSGSFVVVMLKVMVGPDLVTLVASQLSAWAETTVVWVGCETARHGQRYSPRGGGGARRHQVADQLCQIAGGTVQFVGPPPTPLRLRTVVASQS
jgi:hypothetical protein